MKATFIEHEGCFAVGLEAENMAEAALLVRFGMNRTKELSHCGTDVYRDCSVISRVLIGKRKDSNSDVPVRK